MRISSWISISQCFSGSMFRKFGLPLAFVFAIILGNVFILWSSQSKIQNYQNHPPFRLDDYTKSYRLDAASQLSHLLDKDNLTSWQKKSPGLEDKDFDVELTLTHRWDGKEFIPKLPSSIQIETCSYSKLVIQILLREAINIDKVLRLPDDSVEFSQEYSTIENGKINISLDLIRKKLVPSQNYPEGISILTLRGKYLTDIGCLQEISLIK